MTSEPISHSSSISGSHSADSGTWAVDYIVVAGVKTHMHRQMDCPICGEINAADFFTAHRAPAKIFNCKCKNGHEFAVLLGGRIEIQLYGIVDGGMPDGKGLAI